MITSKKIEKAITHFAEGEVFKYDQLDIDPAEYQAAVKTLTRMASSGKLKRVSPGQYYRPIQSIFGEIKPEEEQLLKPYLFQNGKRIAYITGEALYNRMGLTTQVPKNIKVASRDKRIITKVNGLQVKPVKSYVNVTENNYQLLEILDAIKDYKTIPDMDRKAGFVILGQRIQKLKKIDLAELIQLSLRYPPRVRALLGALLTQLNTNKKLLQPLRESLNPLTTYYLGITKYHLAGIEEWNINK